MTQLIQIAHNETSTTHETLPVLASSLPLELQHPLSYRTKVKQQISPNVSDVGKAKNSTKQTKLHVVDK